MRAENNYNKNAAENKTYSNMQNKSHRYNVHSLKRMNSRSCVALPVTVCSTAAFEGSSDCIAFGFAAILYTNYY